MTPKTLTVIAVAKDNKMLVLNAGAREGIREGDMFNIYKVNGGDLSDPETGENLGVWETNVGQGIVAKVEQKHCVLLSIGKSMHMSDKFILKNTYKNAYLAAMGESAFVPTLYALLKGADRQFEITEFYNAEKGDLAKKI